MGKATKPISYLKRRGRLITIYEIKDGNRLNYGWHALGESSNDCRDAQEATRKAFEHVDKAMKSG